MRVELVESRTSEELKSSTCFEPLENIGRISDGIPKNSLPKMGIEKLRKKIKRVNYKETRTKKSKKHPTTPEKKNKNGVLKTRLTKVDKSGNKTKRNKTSEMVVEEPQQREEGGQWNGYNFFVDHIDCLYLPRSEPPHFQIVNKIIESQECSMRQIVTQSSNQTEDFPLAGTQEYIEWLNFSKTNQEQFCVLFQGGQKEYQSYFSFENSEGEPGIEIDLRRYREFDPEQRDLLAVRESFLGQLEILDRQQTVSSSLERVELSEIMKEMLFLGRHLKSLQKENSKNLIGLRTEMERDENSITPPNNSLLDDYFNQLLVKNIRKSLQTDPIQIFNYFKKKSQIQDGQPYRPLSTRQQMLNFIKLRKPSRSKHQKQHLYTSCIACLSPYSEQANRLDHCRKCDTRVHKHCRLFYENQCNVCSFIALTSKNPSLKQCILCPCKDLANVRLMSGQYVHIFCLLVFKLYVIEDQAVTIPETFYEFVGKRASKRGNCVECGSKEGVRVKFEDSERVVHPLCGYFRGYRMSMEDRIKVYKGKQKQGRINAVAFERAYKLNYRKVCYKYYSYQEYRQDMSRGGKPSKQEKAKEVVMETGEIKEMIVEIDEIKEISEEVKQPPHLLDD